MQSEDLPVYEAMAALLNALKDTGSAVLVAPPGAGKTTAVPLALMDQDWLGQGRIILLQPRRLAARSAARRMADLLNEKVGERVGYRMRLDTKISHGTRIEIVTEGVFQRMISDDPELNGVGCVIFDEFHERSLDADLGLALALDVQNAFRPDLRLLVMSATLDDQRVSGLLNDAPIIESKGRQHPIEIVYQPPSPGSTIEEAMANAIRTAIMKEQGSVLAFLPGQAEIRRTQQLLDGRLPVNTFVAPLYGAMELKDQDLAIQPAEKGKRKIVLATAIAETSITIQDVRIVIDSGLARQPDFQASLGTTRLVTRRASKASVIQRSGRAGRTAPGVAIRLWQEAQTTALPDFELPEIMQVDLSGFYLDCLAWGVAGPETLSLIDQPPPPHIAEAIKLLLELGAIDDQKRLTSKGLSLSKLGLGPRLSSMVLEAENAKDATRRAFLALLLGERGVGGTGVDINNRFESAWHEKTARAQALRGLAKRLASKVEGLMDGDAETGVALMLCDAFPDRLARQRPGKPGNFIMANGRGITLDETERLASEQFLVAADIMGSAKSARITSAAALDETDVLDRFQGEIGSEQSISFDKKTNRLIGRERRKIGSITLSEAPRPVQPGADTQSALLDALRQHGLRLLPWSKSTTALRQRLAWLHRAFGAPWPDVQDSHLLSSLEVWLDPFLTGHTNFADLSENILRDALLSVVPFELHQQIDQLAPPHFTAPTGSRIPLIYPEDGEEPTLSIRVQELFGQQTHPSIGAGKTPVNLELLSPAQRPIQITRDLPAFWQGSWADVRAEMRGRYPRHDWPENPAIAMPTRRAKPRN